MKLKDEFYKTNKPLLIYGLPGCGKTTLSEEILNDTIILRIDYYNIKNIKNINEYLYDKLGKKNITLMFSQKIKKRSLLIDDIHTISKYDKKIYKLLIEFIKNNKYKIKIIVTCLYGFLKNKEIFKLDSFKYELKYNYNQFCKICYQIIKDNNIKIKPNEIDKLIHKNKYNFNIFKSELNLLKSLNVRDDYDCEDKLIHNIINNKFNCDELFDVNGDKINISYNLLENNYVTNVDLVEIYKYYVYSDLINSHLMKNCIITNDYFILSIYNINYYFHKNIKNIKNKNIIKNKYVCKSMSNVVSYNKYNINFIYYEFILYLLYSFDVNHNKKYNDMILFFYKNYRAELNYCLKKYNYYYNRNIKLNLFIIK